MAKLTAAGTCDADFSHLRGPGSTEDKPEAEVGVALKGPLLVTRFHQLGPIS